MNNQQKFTQFTKELTELSNKYGFLVQGIGGVESFDGKLDGYTDDVSSGDLEPILEN